VKRTIATLAALAALSLSLVVGSSPAEAAGTITPWQTEVAVGATFSASANGCPSIEEEGETSYTSQDPQLVVVAGTGADARLASFGRAAGGVRLRFTLPGWIDPDQSASIVGTCSRTTYDFEAGTETTEVLFTYPAVAIDIVAGASVPAGPLLSVDRTTAAGGQVLRSSITGCEGSEYASVTLLSGTDLTLQAPFEVFAGEGRPVDDGQATIELALNAFGRFDGEDAGGPVPEGDYVLVATCERYDEATDDSTTLFAAPIAITVSGTNPSGELVVELGTDRRTLTVSGTGCTGGRTVVVDANLGGFIEEAAERSLGRAIARRDLGAAGRAAAEASPDAGADAVQATVTPEADGSWSTTVELPEDTFGAIVSADCGDPLADGFRYVRRFVSTEGPFADVYADRVSPTSSPTSGPVTVQLIGECEGEATAQLVTDDSDVVAESAPVSGLDFAVPTAAQLTAPGTPGEYWVIGACDGAQGDGQPFEVFAPQQIAEGTGPTEPWDGWPETGTRETYDGRLGPITLPAAEQAGTRALGPNELFASVPRPEGDFAITEITFELVYADGTPVDPSDGQIGYFVIMDRSEENPACPGDTFGLPGRLVAAAGAEKTVLESPGPYGIVVEEDDPWTATYRLASLADVDQEVFLSYRFELRRDLENVRPITTYFGSATGCSWFDYTIGGNGGTDVQSHYVTVQADGRLIGAGGSLVTGGIRTDWTNDRGRRICSGEAVYGDDPVILPPDDQQLDPPRTYPDDVAIERIANCPLGELVTAGERLRFDAVYDDARARSGVLGVFVAYVWEGGGPASALPEGAGPLPGSPNYTG
jgi:hypothetical protein